MRRFLPIDEPGKRPRTECPAHLSRSPYRVGRALRRTDVERETEPNVWPPTEWPAHPARGSWKVLRTSGITPARFAQGAEPQSSELVESHKPRAIFSHKEAQKFKGDDGSVRSLYRGSGDPRRNLGAIFGPFCGNHFRRTFPRMTLIDADKTPGANLYPRPSAPSAGRIERRTSENRESGKL